MDSLFLNEFKYKDVVYNNLSEKTRKLLEEKVPSTGTMVVKRNRKPFITKAYPENADTRVLDGTIVHLIGGQRVKSRTDISDPFTGQFVKVINVLTYMEDGAPKDTDLVFERGQVVFEIPLDTFHGRQSAAMFYLLKEFKQNIVGRNGTTEPQDEYMFEVLDAKGMAEDYSKQQFTAAELKMKAQTLTLDQLRLVARATNYPSAETDQGPEYMKVWVLANIESKEGIVKVQSAFSMLQILEVEELLERAWKKDIIYKDDATKMIRYGNNQGGEAGTPIIAYNLNTDNQFRYAAEWLVKPDRRSEEHLTKIRMMVDKYNGILENQIQESVKRMTSLEPLADGPKKPRTEKQLENDRRFAEAARLKAEEKKKQSEES